MVSVYTVNIPAVRLAQETEVEHIVSVLFHIMLNDRLPNPENLFISYLNTDENPPKISEVNSVWFCTRRVIYPTSITDAEVLFIPPLLPMQRRYLPHLYYRCRGVIYPTSITDAEALFTPTSIADAEALFTPSITDAEALFTPPLLPMQRRYLPHLCYRCRGVIYTNLYYRCRGVIYPTCITDAEALFTPTFI